MRNIFESIKRSVQEKIIINPVEHSKGFKINEVFYPIKWDKDVPYLYTVKALIIYRKKYAYMDPVQKTFPSFIRKNRQELFVDVANLTGGERTEDIRINEEDHIEAIDFKAFPELLNVSYMVKGKGEVPFSKCIEKLVLFKLLQTGENVKEVKPVFFDILDDIYPRVGPETRTLLKAFYAEEDPQMNNFLLLKEEEEKKSVPAQPQDSKEEEKETPVTPEEVNNNQEIQLQEADDPLGELAALDKEIDKSEDQNEEIKQNEKAKAEDAGTAPPKEKEDDTEEESETTDDNAEEGEDSGDDLFSMDDSSGDDSADDSGEDTYSDSSSMGDDGEKEEVVNKNILSLSKLDRALADKGLFDLFKTLFSKVDTFKRDFPEIRLKLEDEFYEITEDRLSKLLEILETYINFKYVTNNYEKNLTTYMLFIKTFNSITVDVSERIESADPVESKETVEEEQ